MQLAFVFVIEGRLPGMNDIVAEAQRNRFGYGAFKKKFTKICANAILAAGRVKGTHPVQIQIEWAEPNKRRDLDNIMAGAKFILDALVQLEVIPNDTQKYVTKISHEVSHDSAYPHIKVTLIRHALSAT